MTADISTLLRCGFKKNKALSDDKICPMCKSKDNPPFTDDITIKQLAQRTDYDAVYVCNGCMYVWFVYTPINKE